MKTIKKKVKIFLKNERKKLILKIQKENVTIDSFSNKGDLGKISMGCKI